MGSFLSLISPSNKIVEMEEFATDVHIISTSSKKEKFMTATTKYGTPLFTYMTLLEERNHMIGELLGSIDPDKKKDNDAENGFINDDDDDDYSSVEESESENDEEDVENTNTERVDPDLENGKQEEVVVNLTETVRKRNSPTKKNSTIEERANFNGGLNNRSEAKKYHVTISQSLLASFKMFKAACDVDAFLVLKYLLEMEQKKTIPIMYTDLKVDYTNASRHMQRLNAILEGTKELAEKISKMHELSPENKLLCAQLMKLQSEVDDDYNTIITYISTKQDASKPVEQPDNTLHNEPIESVHNGTTVYQQNGRIIKKSAK
jgi:hypothetical protein